MKHRTVAHTKIEVSPICLGTMTFGTPVSCEDSIRIVHWACDHGINFIDTADIYEGYDRYLGSPGGVAEEILGKALQKRREQVVLVTKVGSQIGGVGYEGKGLNRSHILHQIDASLKRLRTDYVDFYLFHRPDPETPLAESIAVMDELIKLGKVLNWGFSNFEAPQIREMILLCDKHRWPRPVMSQPPYSWLKREVESEHLPTCREFGIAVLPYQPLQGGLLTGKYQRGQPLPAESRAVENPNWLKVDEKLYEKLEQFEAEARNTGLEPAPYAVRWLLDQAGVVSVVIGVKRVEQLESILTGAF